MTTYFASSAPFLAPTEGVRLDALRSLIRLSPGLVFSLKRRKSGFGLFFSGLGKGKLIEGFLMAEKSQQLRVFARAETAFRLLESLGVRYVSVDFRQESPSQYV